MKSSSGFFGVLIASIIAIPSMAAPPGHFSVTSSAKMVSGVDFQNGVYTVEPQNRDGVGIADPDDQNSPCTFLLLGLHGPPISNSWHADLSIATNMNGQGFSFSNLSPPLTPVPYNGISESAGIPLVPCPIPGSGPGNVWLVWSGVNWHSTVDYSSASINLVNNRSRPLVASLPQAQSVSWPPPARPGALPVSRPTTLTPKARKLTVCRGTLCA